MSSYLCLTATSKTPSKEVVIPIMSSYLCLTATSKTPSKEVVIPSKESLSRRRASDGLAMLPNHLRNLEKIYNNTLENQVKTVYAISSR